MTRGQLAFGIGASIVLVLTLGCGPEGGTDNGKPERQPRPGNQGGGADGGQRDPAPAPADPKPSPSSNAGTRGIFVTVSWDGDRQMNVTVYIDGNRTPLVARAKGATSAVTFPLLARVGSSVEATSTPTLSAKRAGANQIWVKTDTEQMVCISAIETVGSASCHGTVPPTKK